MVYKAWRAKIQTTQPPDPPRDGTAGSILAVGEEDLHYEKARNLGTTGPNLTLGLQFDPPNFASFLFSGKRLYKID